MKNREIKFRAYRKVDNWTYDVFSFCDDYVKCIIGEGMINKYLRTDFEPLMQFTGLHDKNGVEIYEGDILGFEVIKNFKEEYVHKFVVTWDNKNAGWIQFSPKNKVVVLGNIHQTPELLS